MVLSFLERQEELQIDLEEVNFTCICLGNLALQSHDDDNSEDSIRGYIQEGHYGLSDYSVVYWQEHVSRIVRGNALDTKDSLITFNAVIHKFLSRRSTPGTKTTNRGGSSISHLNRFKNEVFYPDLVQAMAYTRNEPGNFSTSSKDCRPAVAQLLKIRDIMERVVLEADPSLKERLQMLYGPNIFKCPETQCSFFYEGFPVASQRNAHEGKHRRAFVCTYPGCTSALIGFTTAAELNKHNVDYHGAVMDKHSFPWNGNVASINIEKQIKAGNLSEVQAWAHQWEAKIPMERLWFQTTRSGFNRSPLAIAIRFGKADIFEALLSQAPDRLFRKETIISSRRSLLELELFLEATGKGSKEIASVYLRKLDRIDASLFQYILSLDPEENVFASFLSHVATRGDRSLKDNTFPYLKVAVEKEHEVSTRYILLDVGLWEELHRGPWSSDLDYLGCSGHFKFLSKILPEIGESPSMINSLFHDYCQEGNSRQVAHLLQNKNLNPNYRDNSGNTPLIVAIHNRQFEVIHELLDDPRIVADVLQDGRNAAVLHWAIREGHTACVEVLLDEQPPVEELTRLALIDGTVASAIEYARVHSIIGVLPKLEAYLNRSTDDNLYPPDSTTLIRLCSTVGVPKVRNALQMAPHDLNVADSRGITPFLQAVKCGMHRIVQFLLEQGCDSHASAGPARTSPLIYAVLNNDLEMVRLLLSKACVDPTYKDGTGKTSLDYLNPSSPVANEIRDEIQDAIDVASVFQNADE